MVAILNILVVIGRYLKYLPSVIKVGYELFKLYRKISHKKVEPKIEAKVKVAVETKNTKELEDLLK